MKMKTDDEILTEKIEHLELEVCELQMHLDTLKNIQTYARAARCSIRDAIADFKSVVKA